MYRPKNQQVSILILLIGFLTITPPSGMAQRFHFHIDTLGTTTTRTHQVTKTTEFIEKALDSIVGYDSIGPQKVQIYSYDTLVRFDTTEKTDLAYIIVRADSLWKLGSEFSVQINQLYRNNWAAGGGNSYSFLLSNKSFAYYANRFSSWKTDLDWRYGLQQQEDNPWFKNQDRIELTSIYGFKASSFWNYSALFKFNTQLTKGYESASAQENKENPISRFFTPARSTFSLGMEYANTPKTVFLFLTPLAYRLTYVMDTTLSTRYDVPVHKHWQASLGPMAMLTNKHRLSRDVTMESKLELFANILEMKEPFASVDWKLNLNYRLNRYMTLGIETHMIYDPTVKFDRTTSDGTVEKVRKWQFQESIGLRFVYRMAN